MSFADAEDVLDNGNNTSFTQTSDIRKETVIYCYYCNGDTRYMYSEVFVTLLLLSYPVGQLLVSITWKWEEALGL